MRTKSFFKKLQKIKRKWAFVSIRTACILPKNTWFGCGNSFSDFFSQKKREKGQTHENHCVLSEKEIALESCRQLSYIMILPTRSF